ncbi:MAG TPA: TrbC/VirB2 family protein [Thermoanaerobaculia bacterium]|nr:TrbC/VirB2 family protein [Thermoanaerobaculia bacterium]
MSAGAKAGKQVQASAGGRPAASAGGRVEAIAGGREKARTGGRVQAKAGARIDAKAGARIDAEAGGRAGAGRGARVAAVAVGVALLDAASALAGTGGTDMPWNGPMQAVLDNITGPTGKVIAGLLIALGGIVWGFTRHEEGFKRVAQAIIAIGLVLGATNLVTTLGFQGCVF